MKADKKRKVLTRLKKIEGQLRGIQKMVDQDQYCVDILTQITAVRSATKNVGKEILESHAHSCVMKAVKEGNGSGDQSFDELLETIFKFTK